jgi:hypothetical protein
MVDTVLLLLIALPLVTGLARDALVAVLKSSLRLALAPIRAIIRSSRIVEAAAMAGKGIVRGAEAQNAASFVTCR